MYGVKCILGNLSYFRAKHNHYMVILILMYVLTLWKIHHTKLPIIILVDKSIDTAMQDCTKRINRLTAS